MFKILLLIFISQVQNFYLKTIEIEGNKRVSTEFVKSNFGIQEGQKIDVENIRRGIKNLYKTGYFDHIEVSAQEEDTLVTLVIKLVENPRLNKIIFKENYKIKSKDLEKEISPNKGEPLSKIKIFKWKSKIKDFYRKKGFVGTEIYDSLETLNGDANLIFKIKEGVKAKIKNIEIHGNEHFPDSKLEILLRNREKTWYRKANFKEEYWEEDLPKIEAFYKEKGFLSAKVDSYKIKEIEDSWIRIDIYVTEEKRFYLGDVTFKGDLLFPEKELYGKFKIKKGDPLNYKKLQESIIEIQGMYADKGYLLARVMPFENLQDTFVNLEIDIKKGKEVYIRKIDVKGNTRTRDYVILRELDVFPGMKFSREKLIKSQRDLYFLNYFEDVKVDFDILPDSEHVDLSFNVKEKPTGTIQAGASYSQLQGTSVFVQFTQPNLLGRGQTISLLLEYGKYRKNYQFSFIEPWLFQKPYAVGFDIHDLTSGIPGEYDEKRRGFSVFFSRPILGSDYYRWRIKYSLEEIDVFNISSSFTPSPVYDIRNEKWPKISSQLENSFTRDSRDRVFNEKKGSRFQYLNVLSGWALGGDINFHQHVFNGAVFIPLFNEKIVNMFFIKFGVTGRFRPGDEIPIYEKFRPGGVYTDFQVRGYDDRSLGPKSRGVSIGGEYAFTFNYELRVPVSDNLYFLAFYDAGNAWLKSQSLWKSIKRGFPLYRGIGLGVRIQIPMMPVLGLDFGYGLDKEKRGFIPHFQFGMQF